LLELINSEDFGQQNCSENGEINNRIRWRIYWTRRETQEQEKKHQSSKYLSSHHPIQIGQINQTTFPTTMSR